MWYSPDMTRRRPRALFRRLIGLLVACIVAAAVLGCDSPLSGRSGGSGGAGGRGGSAGGAVRIEVGAFAVQTIVPDVSSGVALYRATLRKSGESDVSTSASSGPLSLSDVPSGTWDVRVEALDGDGTVVGVGTSVVDVSDGSTATVRVDVAPTRDGSGSVDLVITWPAGLIDSVGSAGFGGANIGGEVKTDFGSGELTYSDGHPSGSYRLVINFSRDGNHVATVAEAVHVYDNVSTAAVISLQQDDIATPPDAPTGLSASVPGSASVSLSWNDVSNTEESFVVRRSTSSSGPFSDIATLPAGSVGYLDQNLSDNSTYYYVVSAVNSFGSADTATSAKTQLVSPISGFRANSGNGQVDLRWSDPVGNADLDQVDIVWSLGSTTAPGGVETATATSLTNGNLYTFTATVVDSAGNTSSDVQVTAAAVDYGSLFVDAAAGLTGVQNSASTFGDVDGDGFLDLVVSGLDSGPLARTEYYRNDGAGGFTSQGAVFQDLYAGAVALGDLGGGPEDDVVILGTDGSAKYVEVYDSTADPPGFVSNLAELTNGSISIGDVDGDADLDIVVTGSDLSNNAVSLLLRNDGAFSFTPFAGVLPDVQDSSSDFADVDDDGDLDFVLTGDTGGGPGSYAAELFRNDGTGSFSSYGGVTPVARGSSRFGDVDGDGDPDLVVTGEDDTTVRIATLYLNDGSGSFSDSGIALAGVSDSAIAFGDIDEDTDLDLIITGSDGSPTTVLYVNDGTGNFASVAAGLQPVSGGSVSVGDVENDGDIDLVITGFDGSNPRAIVYENTLF